MDKIAELMAKLAEQYGPNVIEATRNAARIEAFSCLTSSLISGSICAITVYAARYLWKYETEDRDDDGLPKFFAGLCATAALIAGCIAIWNIIDPWTWVAISNPDLWIAKKVFKL